MTDGRRLAEPRPALRIAVVGAGPKALYALEELTAQLASQAGPEVAVRGGLEVTVIDDVRTPGTGSAYDPRQPHHLRLNVTAAILDEPATGDFPAFSDWVAGPYPDLASDPFPPRAVVGEYLAQRWQRMERGLSRHAGLHRISARVSDLERRETGWRLVAGADHVDEVDEVLLATGHASAHPGALSRSWSSRTPLIPAVLPTEEMLSLDRVPPGSRVAVRGAALTFLDACLSLTEARGTVFTEVGGRARRLAIARGGREPAVIRPVSREGLLLDSKPDPGSTLPDGAERAAARARARLASAQRRGPGAGTETGGSEAPGRAGIGPDDVLEIVIDAATAMLGDGARDEVEHTLLTGAEPDLPRGSGRAATALRRSVDVAQGTRRPGPAWALGRMWQTLYPEISRSLRGTEAPEDEWRRLHRSARTLERFAFGPPLVSARKLLALIDGGLVDLSWMDAGARIDGSGVHGAPHGPAQCTAKCVERGREVDVVIDAVLAPPGVTQVDDELITALRRRGLVRTRPGRRGARTDEAGSVEASVSATGAPASGSPGLALIGRPTEDHVIGNDTLNRHLHDDAHRWALRIMERLRAPGPRGAPGPRDLLPDARAVADNRKDPA
ncbi:FAD/NAD(P)-binding protein [Brachybacterium sp. J144]|uniref:FAD/NAD(P)-binding protein n=1 Tax=Brachybacterium sp. J144 TaxID=3116487 RepID=UPI002E7A96DC|nr:FAD/NAD(P)-binding protein [Brachybacterium sp. J144]MEE1650749.1 FAD/NAD(P)-binding protein [Brachybacterium sp. J144]